MTNLEKQTTNTDCITVAKGSVLIGFHGSRGDAWIDNFIPKTAPLVIDQSDPGATGFYSGVTDTSVFVPGDILYMENYKPADYIKAANAKGIKYPVWGGEGCICVGADTFTGLDVNAVSQAGLRDALVNAWKNDAGVALNQMQTNQIQFKWRYRIKILP